MFGVGGNDGGVVSAGAGPLRHRDIGSRAGADSGRDASAGAEEAVCGGERAVSGWIAVQGLSGGGFVPGFYAARAPGLRAEEPGAGRDGTLDVWFCFGVGGVSVEWNNWRLVSGRVVGN